MRLISEMSRLILKANKNTTYGSFLWSSLLTSYPSFYGFTVWSGRLLQGSNQSVAVLGMRNGTSQSPFRPALGRQLVRAADAPLRGHGFGTSRLRQTPTTNGLTAYRMRLHLACVSSGTYGPFATSASRSRLRLPRTTRLALRASLAGSGGQDSRDFQDEQDFFYPQITQISADQKRNHR